MAKFLTLILLVLVACLLASTYGILHDQITYTISPEYYTRFKFYQFGLNEWLGETTLTKPRVAVSLVGIFGTWWTGLPVGLALGLIGLIHPNARRMFSVTFKSMIITLAVAFGTGLLGLAYAVVTMDDRVADPGNVPIVGDLEDPLSFLYVGYTHTFGYVGALPGLLAGMGYSILEWRKSRKSVQPIR